MKELDDAWMLKFRRKPMTISKMFHAASAAVAGFSLATALAVGAAAQADSTQAVKNVVLVHGAWADGSSWDKVIPRLEAKGLNVVAVQLPLTSLDNDVATVERALARQDGPVVLVGHSYAGAVISVAGNDDKVAGLVFVAAFAPDEGQSVFSISQPYPPAPIGTEFRPDHQGFLSVTPKGIVEDFAPDVSEREKKLLVATQGPTNVSCFTTNLAVAAAWKTKPNWLVVAANDRVIPPDLERAEAAAMNATTITLNSSHVVMLSHPKEVADLIEQAAAKSVQK
jgi:pimeloyl-ACP methyl ester carboxylesterase